MPVGCNVEYKGGTERCPRRKAGPKLLIVTPAGRPLEALVAERFAARLLGLAWLPAASAPPLLIPRCRSVHTFGMRFALDVCFLSLPVAGTEYTADDAAVLDVRPRLRPRRFASIPGSASRGRPMAALELAAGTAAALGIEPGASIRVVAP